MKTKTSCRLVTLLLALTMMLSLAACGNGNQNNDSSNNSDGDQQPVALTEEEYQQAVIDLGDKVNEAADAANSLDPNDPEAAKQVLADMKAPFVEFMAITPPEAYAAAHEKLQTGCQAMIDYIDLVTSLIDETDPSKIADAQTTMVELLQTVTNSFTEGSQLLAEAMS